MSSFHWRILRLVGLGMFFDGFDNTMAAGVLGALIKQGWTTIEMNAHFISVTFAGLAIGAMMAGVLGDRLGRKFAYQFNLAIFGTMCIASAFAPSMTWLIALRFVMGIGLGAEYVVGYGMVSEFVPPSRRGWAIGLIAVISMSSSFIVGGLNWLIIPSLGWRAMYLIGGAGALWVWFLRRKLPESPRWLESRGRDEEAEKIMATLEAEVVAKTGKSLPAVPPTIARPPQWVPLSVLFSRPVIVRTLLAIAVCVVALMGSYSFSSWVPTFFVKSGMSVSKSLGFATVMALGSSFGTVTGMLVSDRIGRRRGILLTALWCGLSGLAYAQQTGSTGILVFGFMLQGGMSLLIGFGLAAYTPELFPTEFRFRGSGFAQMTGRVAVVISPYIVVSLFNSYGLPAVMYAISSLYLALALIIVLFGIETNKRSLEAISSKPNEFLPGTAPQAGGTGAR